MDQETLTNHLSHLSKSLFELVCRIVLRGFFNLNVVNVDGAGDGGTDFISVKGDGSRSSAAYQITTQKTQIKNKAYLDAKKAIDKLGADRFYFLTTLALSETETRKIESEITGTLHIPATCFGSMQIAGFLLDEPSLLNQFIDESSYPLPRKYAASPDYREMALHSYTLISKDAISMREGIYDDTILLIVSERDRIDNKELIFEVLKFLGIDNNKEEKIQKRIGALFARQLIMRLPDGQLTLTNKASENLQVRKRVYERELEDLASAQIDIMRKDFNSDWTLENSKSISVFIADIYIAKQIETLKDIKASVTINPIFNVEERGIDSLKKYLLKTGRISANLLDQAIDKLLTVAGDHPLISKLARASVYVALEGVNPMSSSKALGAAKWSDYRILVEPTVAIPWICSQLYKGNVNRFFNSSIRALNRAKELDISLHITYFYINECAGHLLRARKYSGMDLDPQELRFSPNAFISNYFSLREEGVRVPENLMEYLRTFSPAILLERYDTKEWVRAIMTDMQTILTKSSVKFIESPKYHHTNCATFEKEYLYCLNSYNIEKSMHLISHDVWALQLTHDLISDDGQHWLILTFDRSLLDVGKTDKYLGWVATPDRFLDLTENFKPLAEARYISLVHSLATYSEKTLSAGARIIDRIVQYASAEMQNWEFRKELEAFKKGIIDTTDLDTANALEQIDAKTDEFLAAHGIEVSLIKLSEEEDVG